MADAKIIQLPVEGALPTLTIELDFNRWTYSDLVVFARQMQSVGDLSVLYPLAAKVIGKNNWGVVPGNAASIEALEIGEDATLLRFILDEAGKLIENADLNDYPVTLRGRWNAGKYLGWQAVVKRGNPIEAQQWLREVVDFGEPTPQTGETLPELSAIDGAIGIRALTEAYRKLVSGKA